MIRDSDPELEKNPWTVLSTQRKYENDWIGLDESKIIHPGGQPGIYGKVHFKNQAIGILPLDEEGYTWLVGQFRFTLNQYSWEIPEGGGGLSDAPIDIAKRELKEETGIEASQFTPILQGLYLSNSVTDEIGHSFLARELTFGEACPDESEVLQVKKCTIEEAIDMAIKGSITDILSVATLLRVQQMIASGDINHES